MIATSGFLTALECNKFVFRPGLCLVLRWGSSQRSPVPLVGWGGDTPSHPSPISHPTRRFRDSISPLGAFGALIFKGEHCPSKYFTLERRLVMKMYSLRCLVRPGQSVLSNKRVSNLNRHNHKPHMDRDAQLAQRLFETEKRSCIALVIEKSRSFTSCHPRVYLGTE